MDSHLEMDFGRDKAEDVLLSKKIVVNKIKSFARRGEIKLEDIWRIENEKGLRLISLSPCYLWSRLADLNRGPHPYHG